MVLTHQTASINEIKILHVSGTLNYAVSTSLRMHISDVPPRQLGVMNVVMLQPSHAETD